MAFVIGGCIRSGTTMLRNMCDAHPAITATMEFGNFSRVDVPFATYASFILSTLWDNKDRSFLVHAKRANAVELIRSYNFVIRFLRRTHGHRNGAISCRTIESALRDVFPHTPVVGDKKAHYVHQLDDLARQPELRKIIIYRDCRDVVASVRESVATQWRGKPFVGNLDTIEKVVRKWLQAMDDMERHRESLLVVRYEDVIHNPAATFATIGDYLGVDADGFPIHTIRSSSVGRHEERLSASEVDTIMNLAGPTLERYGYL